MLQFLLTNRAIAITEDTEVMSLLFFLCVFSPLGFGGILET